MLSPQERYRIVKNIVARKGIENINLHAELARAESMVNGMDAMQGINTPVASPEPITAPISPEEGVSTNGGEIMPETV